MLLPSLLLLAYSYGALGPAWTYDDSVERPLGEEVHGSAVHAVYTAEQKLRMRAETGVEVHNYADHGEGAMAMAFHWSTEATILFNWWHTRGFGEFVGACSICASGAALLVWMQKKSRVQVAPTRVQRGIVFKAMPALLRTVRIALSYALMLVSMTYNIGLFVALMCGFFVGHLLWGGDDEQASSGGSMLVATEEECCA
jgi:hypothetical protein